MCVLGNRLLMTSVYKINDVEYCTKEKYCIMNISEPANQQVICPLFKLYCNESEANTTCDPYWTRNAIKIRKAFPGFPMAFRGKRFSEEILIFVLNTVV